MNKKGRPPGPAIVAGGNISAGGDIIVNGKKIGETKQKPSRGQLWKKLIASLVVAIGAGVVVHWLTQ